MRRHAYARGFLLALLFLLLLAACGPAPATPPPGGPPTLTAPVLDTQGPLPSPSLLATAVPVIQATNTPLVRPIVTVSAMPPGGAQPVTDADRQWLNQAFTQTIGLSSYHFKLKF